MLICKQVILNVVYCEDFDKWVQRYFAVENFEFIVSERMQSDSYKKFTVGNSVSMDSLSAVARFKIRDGDMAWITQTLLDYACSLGEIERGVYVIET